MLWITDAVTTFKGAYDIEKVYKLRKRRGAPLRRFYYALALIRSRNKIAEIKMRRAASRGR